MIVLGFIVALFLGSKFLPGHQVKLPDEDGSSRVCKLNGLSLFLLLLILVGVGQAFEWISLSVLYTHFVALLIVANVFAIGLTTWLHWRGRHSNGGTSQFLRGFFLGREMNPTLFGVDLKIFSYRPSLIALALFNMSFAVVQYESYGELTTAMMLYQIFTFIYILNYFQFEQGMVHTWDIVSERFGFMLVWGDFVLVPFFYCVTGWALVHAQSDLSLLSSVGLVVLFVFGFWMFRGANQQKHRFKQDANVKIWGQPAEALEGKLLVSGFWGIGRHLNYTGEILVYLAFVLTAGLASWVSFLLPAWLIVLLVHRSWRDEQRCRRKYGSLWDRYTARARFSMVPFVH